MFFIFSFYSFKVSRQLLIPMKIEEFQLRWTMLAWLAKMVQKLQLALARYRAIDYYYGLVQKLATQANWAHSIV